MLEEARGYGRIMGSTARDSEIQATDMPATKRRFRSKLERRQIAEESLQAGASVAVVARRRGVNANQVFHWRKLLREGSLELNPPSAQLIPVRVTEVAGEQQRPDRLCSWRDLHRTRPSPSPRRRICRSRQPAPYPGASQRGNQAIIEPNERHNRHGIHHLRASSRARKTAGVGGEDTRQEDLSSGAAGSWAGTLRPTARPGRSLVTPLDSTIEAMCWT